MARLTVRSSDGTAHATKVGYYDIIDKLAHYEDLADDGKLLELPCGVGDTVYVIREKCEHYLSGKCHGSYGCAGDDFINSCYKTNRKIIESFPFAVDMLDEIGKNVFIGREEAEKALKKKQ